MQKTVEYTVVNNRVSPATVELLISERSKGKTLRQLGQMFGRSHEAVRQVLAKYSPSRNGLLPENAVAIKLGYPVMWLVQLRKEGIINPIKSGPLLYSEEQVRQIPSLIAEARKCEHCGKLRPPGYRRFCRECSQQRKQHPYKILNPEEKAQHTKRCQAWQKANPERWKEIQFRSRKKFRTETPEEERERKSKVALTLWQDPEYRRKQSESRRGNTNALGYRWTLEQKQRLRNARLRRQECIHHWKIDRYNVGHCIKPGCGAVRDFGVLQKKEKTISIIHL